MKYDIFISYRRSGGSFSAKHLRDTLESKGYSVFFDVETLRAGEFNVQLLDIIRECRDFVIVLSPGALDRCRNEDDWVRRELECALENKKNIIPVMLNDFIFPDDLPPSIADLPNYNGVVAAPETYDSTIRRLCSFFQSKPSLAHRISANMKKGPMWISVLLLAAVLAFFGVREFRDYLSVYPRTQVQKTLVSEVIGTTALNMGHFDTAYKAYMAALEESMEYLNAPGAAALSNLKLQYDAALEEIAYSIRRIVPCSETLLHDLKGSPLEVAEIRAMDSALTIALEGYAFSIEHLRDYLMEDVFLQDSTKRTYISGLMGIALLDRDNVFYCTNEMLLPVSGDALSEFKTEFLPEMTGIYYGQTWHTNPDDIKSAMERINNRIRELMMENAMAMGEEQWILDASLSYYEMLAEHAEQLRVRLEERQAELEAKRAEAAKQQAELDEAKQKYYEENRPLEADDTGLLWGKGLRFLKLNMPDAAAECFEMFAQKETADYGMILGTNAAKFVRNMAETGVSGGCIVAIYEEGLPRQALDVGDIIYAVDGENVLTADAYIAFIAKDGNHVLSILRFTDTGYEKITVPYDSAAGRVGTMDLNEP